MNILLTSVGRRTYLVNYFKHALKNKGEIHVSNSEYTLAFNYANKSVITPLIFNKNYVEFLLNYCLLNDISAIIPLFDIDLLILSKNIDLFSKNNIRIIVSPYETINICNDKWKTFNFLRSNKFSTPDTYLSLEKCKSNLNKKLLTFPLIIKPRWGMGSVSMYEIDSIAELEILYLKVKKDVLRTYLKYESNEDLDKCVVIQEKIPGTEYGLDLFNNLEGRFLTCVPKKKIAMRAGETDIAEIVNNRQLMSIGLSLSKSLNFIANLDVDLIKNENKYFIIDINCRFGGQYPFSHLAGVNFPETIVDMLANKIINKENLMVKYGTMGVKDIKPIILNKYET